MSIAAAGAAMVSIIEHAGDARSPEIATWVLSGSVAIALVTIAIVLRTLDELERYKSIYLFTSTLMIVMAIAFVPISLWRPEPIILVSMLLGQLSLEWLVAVYLWIRTGSEEVQ